MVNKTYIEEAELEIANMILGVIKEQYYFNDLKECYTNNGFNQCYRVDLLGLKKILDDLPNDFKGMDKIRYNVGLLSNLNICKSLNTFTATAGITSGAYSVSCLVRTKNPIARWFYITGLSCSGVGTTLSAVAALGQPPGCCSYSC